MGLLGPGTQPRQMTGAPPAREREASAPVRARPAEQRPSCEDRGGGQAHTHPARQVREGSRPRRGCRTAGARGERDAAAESEHRRRRPPGLASCWDGSRIALLPPARALLSAQPAVHVTATERPRGREAGSRAGLRGRGAGRKETGRVLHGQEAGQPKGRGFEERGLRGEEPKGGGRGGLGRARGLRSEGTERRGLKACDGVAGRES